jgi:hypothetical protein
MAQRGGARPGSGRKPGVVTKAKRELAEMAKDHAAMALQTLADIAQSGESEAARVSAANGILDRAYGKPAQAMIHTGKDGGPIQHAHQLSDEDLAAIATGRSPRATPQA